MTEITALKAMLDFKVYVQYGPVLSELDNMQKEHRQVLDCIGEYYKKYKDKKSISIDELETFFFYLNPMVPKEPYIIIFNQLRTTEIGNPELVDDILHRVIEVHTCAKVAQVAMSVVEGQRAEGVDEIQHLITEHKDTVGEMVDPLDLVCNTPLEELLRKKREGGVKWRLRFLNETFGPLRPRTLGHIIARPDGGKTSFALNQVSYFAYQMAERGKKLLYLNNEEDIEIVRLRLYSAMTGWDEDWIASHQPQAESDFESKGGGSIYLIGEVDHINKVEQILHRFKPYITVIDQGPKVSFPGSKLSEVERKQRLYERYRSLAKQYDTVLISLGQADSDAEGKKWIGLNNLDGSKVGIPGELDWCLGIGKNNDPGYENTRYLNIAKNKLSPHYGRAEVIFNVKTCRYEDVR